jgi:hypothetical protein
VLHSCVTDCSIDLRTKNILHVKSLPTKGQDKKKRKREDNFFFMPSALMSMETDLRDCLGLKVR